MKIRIYRVIFSIAVVIIGGILLFDLVFNNNDNIPLYVKDFVSNNPQAIELVDNYQSNPNNNDISLSIPSNIPLYLQWDSRWAFNKYGDEIIGTAGCGPTSLSMVAVGLTGNTTYNPRFVANYAINNDYLEGSKTKWALMEQGCDAFGLSSQTIPLDKNIMISHLNNGEAIIASVRAGDFTNTGHFIVISSVNKEGFKVNDPNSEENSNKIWSYERLQPQIKALWAFKSKVN